MKNNVLLEVKNLKTYFMVRRGFLSMFGTPQFVRAVDDVSFYVKRGEIFSLAGESGSGKTTTGKSILRLVEPTSGDVHFDGRDILSMNKKELKKLRRDMQIIFQDPYESLNPRQTVFDIISEPLEVNNLVDTYAEKVKKVSEALQDVELSPPEEFMNRYPHELSGGQRQRVAVASTLVLKPKFIVADEPVSMVDVSIRAGILNLMANLKEKMDLTYLLITHDLSVARYMCDRIAIMYLGKIMETGPTGVIVDNPLHPYTEALISVIPVPDPKLRDRERLILRGEIPDPVNVPPGCRFHPRCSYAIDVCREAEPEMVEVEKDHFVACHVRGKKA